MLTSRYFDQLALASLKTVLAACHKTYCVPCLYLRNCHLRVVAELDLLR